MSQPATKNVSNTQRGRRVTVTVTYGRPRLIGLLYVVEMCRKVLPVLRKNNLLAHVTKRYDKYTSKYLSVASHKHVKHPARPQTGVGVPKNTFHGYQSCS